jgi:hypothetical protein
MEFSQNFVNNLIASAKYYRSYVPSISKLPNKFDDIKQAKSLYTDALMYEAHHALQNQLHDYSEPLLSIVDIDTPNPGVVVKFESDCEVLVCYNNGEIKEYNNIYNLNLYASPLPFDRHINGLGFTFPNIHFESILCNGTSPNLKVLQLKDLCRKHKLKISGNKQELIDRLNENYIIPSITLYHGPPGTGKTYTTLKLLQSMMEKLPTEHRFLICAPSNVGVLNMYSRAYQNGIKGTLVMNEDKIPENTTFSETERESWDAKKDRIVFSTISGRCGSILKKECFHTIIIDEAAQCQEAWVWSLFRPEVKHVIMAGDPHQLPSLVHGVEYNHGISLMERLMNLGYKSHLLNTQRRMHPEIVKFPNDTFYQGKLNTDFNTFDEKMKPYQIIDINSYEEKVGTSYMNTIEAKVVVSLVQKIKQVYSDTVVISPYKGQIELLKKLDSSLTIHTVDSFQGKEADAIILTTVRRGSSVGFWQDSRRLNVALTRAKHVLRIVGNTQTWLQSSTVMKDLGLYGKSNGFIKQLNPNELQSLNIDLCLGDIKDYIKTTLWSNPIIESRALSASKNDKVLEYALVKVMLKLCTGSKLKSNETFNTYTIENKCIDWSVYLDENKKQLGLKFHNVRYSGHSEAYIQDIKKNIQKFGPEWNACCVYGNGPKVFSELPFKGKRPPVVVEVKRDRTFERINAMKLVKSFRK